MVPQAGDSGKCHAAAPRAFFSRRAGIGRRSAAPPGKERKEALAHSVLATEFINPTARIDDLLFAGIKRVARRADLDLKILAQS